MEKLPNICNDCPFNWSGFCSLKVWLQYSKRELVPFDLDVNWGITECKRAGIKFED